ncbi:uncharacterized protein LOC124486924 [Hypomesus transpacificus]|uniref:uncharacterized protein LOC124486924 n=1 Tax=Hypomesus transpacificus TaxID=137520 RepID=UPI001F07952D|nr:uncharacterized protein LOC124486924 [Hypomesus transpacificus]
MAENVRSPFDYREPPTLDSDGDGSKPPPPRGRVCGRKRKGTPVKVCDRAYVTEDEEEESLSEHSYSPGDGQYPEGAEDRLPPPGSPYYLADPSQICVSELGEEGASGVRGSVLFHPPPNCRIREVHCGSQVRLVVIAIRDIAKGEEITVDYSLTDWGENAMKRKLATAVPAKKKSPANPRGPGRPCSSFTRPAPAAPPVAASRPQPPAVAPAALAPPTTNINNNININIGSSSAATVSRRQHCPYCGRHYRSLARHLEKHHANQPERERDSPATRAGAVSFSLSLSPPSAAPAAASKKGTGPPAPKRASSSSATAAAATPRKEEEKEEMAPPPTPDPEVEADEEELELSGGEGEEVEGSPEDKNGEMASSHRQHMPPLLSSLSCLVLYLRRQQHSSFLSLTRSSSSAEAWRLLCHSSLALLILYNRHRECEVAKLTIQDYRKRATPQTSGSGQANSSGGPPTGLEVHLSPFERQVLCHLPRAGVLGKRGRIQPLILPPHCEPCLDLLLHTSPNVGVDPHSPYIFSRPYHSPATPLRGTDMLRNMARASGAKNPTALTQTRARRQVAILTQLLLLEEGEGQGPPGGAAAKRLEDFLQAEYHVTQTCATIGRDPALMGRVGRVVLYGEREGVLFRGMSLQHICLELDVMSGNSADSFSDESEGEAEKEVKEKAEVVKKKGPGRPPRKRRGPPPSSVNPSLPGAHKRRSVQPKSGKRGVLKRPWSEAERVAVETHLNRNIVELRVPAKADCERCLQLCPLLVSNQRDWRAIKFYCHNRIQLLKKQGRRESAGQGGAA